MKQTQNFTEGKIFAPLIRFALPVLLALFLQTMYGAVDQAFDKTVTYIKICSAALHLPLPWVQ